MSALAASFWLHDLWHPLVGRGYQFWSGIAGSFVLGGGMWAAALTHYRRHVCQAPRCLRLGRHRTADGLHYLCGRHHPDLPDRRLSLAEIHVRHRLASGRPRPAPPPDLSARHVP